MLYDGECLQEPLFDGSWYVSTLPKSNVKDKYTIGKLKVKEFNELWVTDPLIAVVMQLSELQTQ